MTGATVTIDSVRVLTDFAGLTFQLIKWNSNMGNPIVVDAITASGATGAWIKHLETTISNPTVNNNEFLGILPSADNADLVKLTIFISY